MTGCPNGCARPYNSRDRHRRADQEGLRRLRRWLGRPATAWAERIRTDVPLDQLAATLAPVFAQYAAAADRAATFGDWSHGVGAETIATWLPEPVVAPSAAGRSRPRLATDASAVTVAASSLWSAPGRATPTC